MIKQYDDIHYTDFKAPKPQQIVNDIQGPTQVFRLPNGRFTINGAGIVGHPNGPYELRYTHISLEDYATESEATNAMLKGSYKLEPDFKSYFLSYIHEEIPLSEPLIKLLPSGVYVIAIAELNEDDDVSEITIGAVYPISQETFETVDEAKSVLETGNWTHWFRYYIPMSYTPQHKLRVMLTKDGKYILGRNRIYENVDTGEAMVDLHEYIHTKATTKEDAELELKAYLGGL